MEAYRLLNTLVSAFALLILAAHAVRVATAAIRSRRAGAPAATVGAGATAQLIGLGLAAASAVAGGYLIYSALQPLALQPMFHLIAQVLVAGTASWIVGRVYSGWVAQPVYNWFAGEEGAGHDR